MSWEDVKYVLSMDPRWKDALQCLVLMEIAKRYNPRFGYAWPALATIGTRVHRSPRRINEVIGDLEALGLVIRLGPDPDVLGTAKGTNRFVPIWRVEGGVQQMLREAADEDAAGLEKDVTSASEDRERGASPRMGACEPSHGGHASPRMGGTRALACDLSSTYNGTSQVPLGTRTATAAAQPRLPTLLAQVRRTLVEEILRKRLGHFTADPATDDNFKLIAKVATDVLADPALGARLLKGYDPTRPSDVREAVRRLCDKRHVDWGKPSYDRLDGAVAWAEVKPSILAGEARPRDRARRRRAR